MVLHHGTVLPCEAQGFPRPSITWQREGVPIATGKGTVVFVGEVHIGTISVYFAQQQFHKHHNSVHMV